MRLQPTLYVFILAGILLAGLGLRIVSFTWNTRLYGDVNLFALAAREYALHGRLQYPMKYEFSDNVPYLALTTPASQHPPLWSWLGGSLAKLLDNADTFSMLKALGLLSGMGLLLSLFSLSKQMEIKNEALIAIGLAAVSPVLVDFSANGSMYILSGWIIVMASLLLLRFNPARLSHSLLAGVLCGLGCLVHSSLSLLPLAFLLPLISSRASGQFNSIAPGDKLTWRQRLGSVSIFLLALLASLSPWFVWDYQNFERPFYSLSSNYLLDRLGLLKTGIYGNVISARLSQPFSINVVRNYIILAEKAWWASVRQMFTVLGPFILLLIILGLLRLFKGKTNNQVYAVTIPALLYGLAIALWATNKFRFLVPLLAPFYLLAALGYCYLAAGEGWRKWLGWLCLSGGLVWMGISYLGSQPTFYYGKETAQDAQNYDRMRLLAQELTAEEAGVTLGVAQALDGGIETIYWTSFPFVAARGMDQAEIQKLGEDFRVRYIWADETTLKQVQEAFPKANAVLENSPFYVFELAP
jgi:uncharacterized membrane protein